jgi:hypothetical protein
MDVPPPWRAFAGRELVVIAAGEGLKGDQVGVVAEQDADVGGGFDVGLGGIAGEALPA